MTLLVIVTILVLAIPAMIAIQLVADTWRARHGGNDKRVNRRPMPLRDG
jgi:hypothetical protein